MIKTELKIPELRFPEFEGEWVEKKLGEIGTFTGGGTPSTENNDFWEGNIPWVSSSDISEDNILNINISRYITEEAIAFSATKVVPANSILIVSRVGVGKLAINLIPLCTSQDFFNLTPTSVHFLFLAYLLNNSKSRLKSLEQGTSIKGFVKDDFIKLKIAFPSLPEQQKIADFLSAVDKRLQSLKDKKIKLEEYKRGVMQRIFLQELRFTRPDGSAYPDWEEKRLGEIGELIKGKQLNGEFLTDKGKYPVINGGVSPSGYYNEFNTLKNTITISEGGNSCGYVNFITTNFWSGGHCYTLEEIKSTVIVTFLYQYLKYRQNEVMRLRVGTGLPNIQRRDLLIFKIDSPSLPEQRKIAEFLSAIDDKITLLTKQIESTEQYKKGLLQQLFV